VQRLGWGLSLRRQRERLNLAFAIENLTDRYYRDQFQFAPSRGRTFTVGRNGGLDRTIRSRIEDAGVHVPVSLFPLSRRCWRPFAGSSGVTGSSPTAAPALWALGIATYAARSPSR
jgi:hypothetical protein